MKATAHLLQTVGLLVVFFAYTRCVAVERDRVSFGTESGKILIVIGGKPMATYVYDDEKIPRPYFANVRAPGGVQVTRNHPPIEGKDPVDHAEYHPGIWLAFEDLSGADFWRNRARVEHVEFVQQTSGGDGKGTFTVRNRYVAEDGKVICTEVCRHTILVRPAGYLLIYDSGFSSDRGPFVFGDKKASGLGVRVASPIRVGDGNGQITNSDGLRNEQQAMGKQADWCDFSGTIDGRHAGLTLMPDPGNFRRSWFFARNYGCLLANPFGRKFFSQQGEDGRVVVQEGDTFRLRFGVLIHAAPAGGKTDLKAAYADYLQVIKENP